MIIIILMLYHIALLQSIPGSYEINDVLQYKNSNNSPTDYLQHIFNEKLSIYF